MLLLAAIPLMVYWQTIENILGLWPHDAYRHGYMIPVISVFLLWRDRSTLVAMKAEGSWLGIAAVLLLVALWVVAEATSVQGVEQMAVVLMVSAFMLAVVGWDGYKRVWFPLAFLLFAVPVGDSVIPQLMNATATVSVAALRVMDVPALREGMLVSLPGGTFEVVEACSGFNYLNAGLALGVLVAHLMFRNVWKQLGYVAAVSCVFVFVNGLRAFVVMFIGSMSHMQLLVGRDHIFFGWVLFLVAMALMYWVAEKYSDMRQAEPTHAPE